VDQLGPRRRQKILELTGIDPQDNLAIARSVDDFTGRLFEEAT
jgi:hypothetical protein